MNVLLPLFAAVAILSAPPALCAAGPALAPAALRALDMNNALASKVGALERQFQEVKLNSAFTAASLTSAQGISHGRATLDRLRGLTAQRMALVQAHFDALEQLRASSGGSLAGVEAYLEKARLAHQLLHGARADLVSDAATLLDWAEAEHGHMQLENGGIRFSTPALQGEFNDLFARLDRTLKRHETAVDQFEAFRKANQGRFLQQPIPAQGKPVR